MTIRTKGLALQGPARPVDPDGFTVTKVDSSKVDIFAAMNRARDQIFPNTPVHERQESNMRFQLIMQARRQL